MGQWQKVIIFRCGPTVIVLPSSYLHNAISYTGKTSSLYWIGPPVIITMIHTSEYVGSIYNRRRSARGSLLSGWVLPYFQNCMPARIKGLHYNNLGPIAETMVQLFMTFMKKKLKDRVSATIRNFHISLYSWRSTDSTVFSVYRKVSNIRRTQNQNLNNYRLSMQLPLPNPLKPGVKSRMKM